MTSRYLPDDLDRRLAAELVPVRPAPPASAAGVAEHREPAAPVTEQQAAHNRAVLLAALTPGRRRAA